MKQRVVFYQHYPLPYFGIVSIAGHLKQHGVHSEVVVASLEKAPLAVIAGLAPTIVGISAMSVEHRWLAGAASQLRKALPDAVIIVGGIHAVLYPEEVMSIPEVDLVCTGDGEEVMLRVVRILEASGADWSSVSGIGYRDKAGRIVLNERASLFSYDSELVEDRDMYYKRYPRLAQDTAKRFISSRGCPYKCSFCYNEQLQEVFKGHGQYIRRKDAENLIEEIRREQRKNKIDAVYFMDDLFTMDKAWLGKFLLSYRKEIAVPFVCTTRANIMDEERAAMLAEAGCRTISYGIETGNYHIRKNVLNKDITDEAIVTCGRLLKRYGLKTLTTNMFCLPGETLEDAFKTIGINIQAGTDFAFASLLMPFPKTRIAEYCMKQGIIKADYSLQDLPESFMTRTIIDIRDKKEILNVQRLSYYFVRHPWFYRKCKWMVRVTAFGPLYEILFAWSNFLRHKGERGISFIAAFRYAWRMRKYF